MRNWKDLAPFFGINEWMVEEIEENYPNEDAQRYKALLCWKRLDPSTANYEALVECLLRHGCVDGAAYLLGSLQQGRCSGFDWFFTAYSLPLILIIYTCIIALSFPTALPPFVQRAQDELRRRYTVTDFMGSLWPGAPNLGGFDQSLAVIPGGHHHYFSASQYEVFDGTENKDIISSKTLLNRLSQKESNIFILSGPRGSGKTVLMKQLCACWAKQYALREFLLVLYINMKSRDPDGKLQYSVQNQLHGIITEDVWQWIDQKRGKDVLFILDGYEEDPAAVGLEMSTNIATCTYFYKNLQSRIKFCSIQLLGLSDGQIAKEVVSTLGPGHASDFLLYLSENPDIKSILVSSPVNLVAVIYVFSHVQPNQLPTTLTQLFTSLTYLLVLSACEEELKLPDDFNPQMLLVYAEGNSTSLEHTAKHSALHRPTWIADAPEAGIREDVTDALQQICQMGFDLMGQQVFQSAQLQHNILYSFFITDHNPPEMAFTEPSPTFTVPLLQEFLAAWWILGHIARMSVSCATFPYIWQFYAGLSDASAINDLLGDHLDDKMSIMNCLFENAGGEITKRPFCNMICIKNELLSVHSISHICWCLEHTINPQLELRDCILEAAALWEMSKYLVSTCCLLQCNHCNLTVLRFRCSGNKISDGSWASNDIMLTSNLIL